LFMYGVVVRPVMKRRMSENVKIRGLGIQS